VKCDEAKPACSRCTSTGRSCDFTYPQKHPLPLRSSKVTVPKNVSLTRVAKKCKLLPRPAYPPSICFSPNEGNQLEFFRIACTRPFSGYFDNPFWDKTLLQISSTEPSIRSALVAFASLIQLHTGQGPESNAAALEKVNLEHQKAVRELNRRLDSSKSSLELALVGSLLFAAFEINQGHDEAANLHFNGGFAVLQEYTSRLHVCFHFNLSNIFCC